MKKKCEPSSFLPRKLRKALLAMKFLCLLLLFSLQLTAKTYSQKTKLTFSWKNISLVEVFSKIRTQSEYTFVYNLDDVEDVRIKTVSLKNATVEEVLNACLRNTGFDYAIEDQVIVIKPTAKDQDEVKQITVKGKVVDVTGTALPGVTVRLKGTTLGASCDKEGNFSFVIPESTDPVLVFTFIGLKSREVTYKGEELKVIMEEDVASLDDVVVTGYSRVRKVAYAGNATQISREELLKVENRNLINALQFFDPSFRVRENTLWGSDPNALPEMRLRGESSISGNIETENLKQTQRTDLTSDNPNLPIFILDDFEVSVQKIYDMDMNRIESVTILKDAAATALYGAHAANGVVVITTIPPKPGEMMVDYSFTMRFMYPDLSDYNLANAAEKLEIERLAGVYTSDNPSTQASLDISYNELRNQIVRGVNTDWLALPLRNTYSPKHTFSFSGGVQSLRYLLGFRYEDGKGVMKGSKRDKLGAELQLIYMYKKLRLMNTTTYDKSIFKDSHFGNFSDYVKQQPYIEIYDEDGNYIRKFDGNKENPLWKTSTNSYSGKGSLSEYANSLSFRWSVLDDLLFTGQFKITKTEEDSETFQDPKLVKYDYYGAEDKGSLAQTFKNNYNWDLQMRMEYTPTFGKHYLTNTLIFQVTDEKREKTIVEYLGFQLGQFISPAYAARQKNKNAISSIRNRSVQLKGNINYSYDDIVFGDVSLDYDGNSQFGSDKRFGLFWSVAGGTNIQKFGWFRNSNIGSLINELRIRASYGVLGNTGFDPYAAVTTYLIDSQYWYYMGPSVSLYYLGNPELEWQTTRQFDASLSLKLWNSRVTFLGTYYRKKTLNMVDKVSIQSSSGFNQYQSNMGTLLNEGMEFSLTGTPIQNKDWRLHLTFNLASNRNKIIKLGAASQRYNELLNENYDAQYPKYSNISLTPVSRYYEGASTTAIYAVRSAGIDPANGKEKFIKRSGTSTYTWCADDQVVVGDKEPDAQGSFSINLMYRGLYIQTGFGYNWGGQIYNETLLKKVEDADIKNSNVDKRVLTERWKKPGDVSPYYDLQNTTKTKPTSRFVQTENVLYMRSLSVGYYMDRELLSRWKIRSMDLSFMANDLFRWSSIKMERGINYPFAHNFSIVLRLGI